MWSLDGLLQENTRAELEQQLVRFEARREMNITDGEFFEMLHLLNSISRKMARLEGYAYLRFAEDTRSQSAASLEAQTNQLCAEARNRITFFKLWWKGLGDERAQQLIAGSGDYAYYLESLRRFKPYTLSEPEERIINLKDVNGPNALVKLYQMITNRFSFQLEVDGETKEMTRAELTPYICGASPEMRVAAYQELFRVFSDQGPILGELYANRVRDRATENLTLRGYSSPIAIRNLDNDIPDSVVDMVLNVCRENVGLFRRFFKFKATQLGMDKLQRYDLYAPISGELPTYTYDEATEVVLDVFNNFAPVMAEYAHRVLYGGHIDAEIRPGKRGGAFSAGWLPEIPSWVMLSYDESLRAVFTLAHELGHAVHHDLAQERPILVMGAALPLAETASMFAEMLLTEHMLEETCDASARREILNRTLTDAYAGIVRQAYFTIFEQDAHKAVMDGATTDDLCDLYFDNLREQFGDAVDLSEDFRWEWLLIRHIFCWPFYCYAYSFGQLLVLALYQQYREEGVSFVPRYLKMLAYGGSRSPEYILNEAGFNIHSPAFWQGGFNYLEEMLDELESTQIPTCGTS